MASQEEDFLDLAWLTIKDASAEFSSAVSMEATRGPSNAVSATVPQEPSSSSSGWKRKIGQVEKTTEERQSRERRKQNQVYKEASRERKRHAVHYRPTSEKGQIACLRSRVLQLKLQLWFCCQGVEKLQTAVTGLLLRFPRSVPQLTVILAQVA